MLRRQDVWIPVLGLGLLVGVGSKYRSDCETAREQYRAESEAAARLVSREVERTFQRTHEGLRTIARLPSLCSIGRSGLELDGDARAAALSIHASLALGSTVDDIFVVPAEELGRGMRARATRIHFGDDARGVITSDPIPLGTLALLREHFDSFPGHGDLRNDLLRAEWPAACGPEVRTNSDGDERGERLLVCSVPYFGTDEAIAGCVAATLRVDALRDLMPGGSYALRHAGHDLTIGSREDGPWRTSSVSVAAEERDADLEWSTSVPLDVPDRQDGWTFVGGKTRLDALVRP